jgi:hypothetical protein
LVSESLWQMPQASTLIRTDPGPGSGTGRSTISKGPFGRETCTTRIVAMISLQSRFDAQVHSKRGFITPA